MFVYCWIFTGIALSQDGCNINGGSLSSSSVTSTVISNGFSFTRLNAVITQPTKEDLNKLMKDFLFVDFFNVFLNQPVS